MNPGPACTSQRVKNALLRGDLCHCEPGFTELLTRIREGLPRCLNLVGTHEALLVTGSGTAAMEMAVISSVREGRSVLAVNNGVYGERMIKLADEAVTAIRQVSGLHTGTPVAGGTTTVGTYLLPPLLAAFRDQHPGIEVGIYVGNGQQVERQLVDGEIGVAVLAGEPGAAQLVHEPILQDRLVLITEQAFIALLRGVRSWPGQNRLGSIS